MSKPNLILIHGYAETAFIFEHLAEPLQAKYQVWLPELPGFGITNPPLDYSIKAYADWIYAYMQHNGIEKAHLAGHSMGGYIAAQFAALYGNKVDTLNLIHAHAGADGEERTKKRNDIINAISKYGKKPFPSLFYNGLFEPQNVEKYKEQIEIMYNLGMKMPDKTLIELQISMQNRANCVTTLANSHFPIRFFAGTNDPLIAAQEIEDQALQMPNAVVFLEKTAHMGLFECTNKLLAFLNF